MMQPKRLMPLRLSAFLLAVTAVSVLARTPIPLFGQDAETRNIQPSWSWVAAPAHIKGRTWLPQAGELTATLDFDPVLFGESKQALDCDGRRQAGLAAASIAAAQLPTKSVSLEAWVLLRAAAPWGGFISALQDNGDYERGMLLGYRESKFCLAIATEKAGKLTYLTAEDDFDLNQWYHVVGTYDGRTMQLYVNGQRVASSDQQQGEIWLPPTGVVALAAYRDDNELYRLNGAVHAFSIYGQPLSTDQVYSRFTNWRAALPQPDTPESESQRPEVFGPFVTSVDDNTWSFEWTSDVPCVGYVEIGASKYDLTRIPEDGSATTQHRVVIRDLPRDRVHQFRIGGRDRGGQPVHTRLYPLDTMLHYPPPARSKDLSGPQTGEQPTQASPATSVAEQVLQLARVDKGYAFVIDGSGDLAIELAERSRLQIVVVQPDPGVAHSAREKLHRAKLYGTRVTVQQRPFDQMDYGPFLANIVVSDPARWVASKTRPRFDDLYAILKPSGGTLFVGGRINDRWSQQTSGNWSHGNIGDNDVVDWVQKGSEGYFVLQRGKLPGASEWTHQYGRPNNTSCNEDDLIRGDLSVLWWGRPGPRPMPDRGPRNPAPVSANGRLYIQGNRTLFGLDSYNGSILWFHQIPTMRRANIPRDGSNMVATDDYLYLAMQGHCIGFNGQTGQRDLLFSVPGDQPGNERRFDWGIVACYDDLLFGSAVKRGSHYLGDDGEWFEDFAKDQIARVASAKLFAVDRHSGDVVWQYDRGTIMNSTFSVDKSTVYFLEGRSASAASQPVGRLLEELQTEQYLVALNQRSGGVLWERAVDLSHCQFMTYMCVAGDTLIVAGTDQDKSFHTQAFSAVNGNPIWQHTTVTNKTHHSGHLSHPLVIGDRVFVNKLTFDRKTGKVLDENKDFDWHGCGVTSASRHTIFRRYEYHGMMDLETRKRTEFLGVRSGCWLSIIPSGGTVLAPETSAGCSCTHAVQTSLAYVPRYLLPNHEAERE